MGLFQSVPRSSSTVNSNRPSRTARFTESNEDGFHLGALVPCPVLFSLEHAHDSECPPQSDLVQRALATAEKIAADRIFAGDDQLAASLTQFGGQAVVAAIAYSLEEPPLYREFNEAVRKGTMEYSSYEDFFMNCNNLRSYTHFYRSLNSIEAKVPALSASVILYRGCEEPFRARVGQTVSLPKFHSTSTNAILAQSFAGPTGTLIIFTGPLITGLDMRPLSVYPDEDEVLLFPLQTFQVQSIEKHGLQTVITLYSQKAKAVEAFIEIDRFFPPDSTHYLMYQMDFCHFENLYLPHYELARIGYLPPSPTELPHINHLPAYDIVLKDDVKQRSTSFIFLNIAAVRDKYTKGKTVYVKQIKNEHIWTYYCHIFEMPANDVKSLLEPIEQADPAHLATSYIISAFPTDVQVVYDLMPKQYHHLLRVQSVLHITKADQILQQFDTSLVIIFFTLSFLFCLCPLLQQPQATHHRWLTTRRMLALARARRLTSQRKALRCSTSSPPQLTTATTTTDPIAIIFITALLQYRYVQLKFPHDLKELNLRLPFHVVLLSCSICGESDRNRCTCSKRIT